MLDEYVSLVKSVEKPSKRLLSDEQVEEMFAIFWSLYPIKKGKLKAAEAFIKACKDEDTFLHIIAELNKQIKYKAHCDKRKEFCPEFPFPQGWLNQQRWQDETPDVSNSGYVTPKNTIDERLK